MENYYITFDIGRVLVNVDFTEFLWVYKSLSLDQLDDPMAFLFDLHGQQDVGLTTIARAAKERFGIPQRSINDLVDAWNRALVPEPAMMALLDRLRQENWNVALLSNMGSEHAEHIRSHIPKLFSGCDLHLSYEVGARKPSKLYYQSFLMDHPEYKGCLYVDDLPQNLAIGRYYGFRGFKYNIEEDGLDCLEDLEMAISDYKEEIDKYGCVQSFPGVQDYSMGGGI